MSTSHQRSDDRSRRPGRLSSLAGGGALGAWLSRRVAVLRADLAAVTAELRGERLPPVVRVGRQPARHGLTASSPPPASDAGLGDGRRIAGSAASPRFVTARMTLGGVTQALQLRTDAPILAQALAAGLALPYSCQAGGCGACRLRCISGTVRLPDDHALSPAELAAGFTLTCVGVAEDDVALAEADA